MCIECIEGSDDSCKRSIGYTLGKNSNFIAKNSILILTDFGAKIQTFQVFLNGIKKIEYFYSTKTQIHYFAYKS